MRKDLTDREIELIREMTPAEYAQLTGTEKKERTRIQTRLRRREYIRNKKYDGEQLIAKEIYLSPRNIEHLEFVKKYIKGKDSLSHDIHQTMAILIEREYRRLKQEAELPGFTKTKEAVSVI